MEAWRQEGRDEGVAHSHSLIPLVLPVRDMPGEDPVVLVTGHPERKELSSPRLRMEGLALCACVRRLNQQT